MNIPKYAKLEIERRWLLPAEFGQTFINEPYKLIEDLYLECGRLRLRKMTDSETNNTEYKLCKKYGQTSELSEPITNIYLNESEYNALATLKGNRLQKRRYKKDGFSFDVFENGLILCEKEGADIDSIKAITPLSKEFKEVTRDPKYSGIELSRTKCVGD